MPLTAPPLRPAVPANVKTWHCGTLVYTKIGLITLFAFLLWGDFCAMMMQMVIPSILPIKLKALGASNILIGVLLTSVFSVLGIFVSPYLSFKSDYLRTRWGRRIPFFVASLPLVVASILLLAFSEDIAAFLHRTGMLGMLSPAAATILVISVFVVAFQVADVFIMSVFNYIFNDTVPLMFIGRFVGLMRIVGGVIGFLYNFYVFKYAESHMREIFVGTAFLYLTGIGMVCLFVKEGEYPPVTEEQKKQVRGIAGLKTYFRECFSHKFYWTKFLYSVMAPMSYVVGPFNIFFYREMGLTLEFVGKAAAIGSASTILAACVTSMFIDRWHPLRILAYSYVFAGIFTLSNWVWIFVTLSPGAFFWLHMLGAGIISAFHGSLSNLAAMPFDVRLHPKSRYGQFCSAQSILVNGCRVLAGFLVGFFFDCLRRMYHGSDFAYRFAFVWTTVFYVAAGVVVCVLYLQWHKMGGDRHFRLPAPWSKTGYEELEPVPFVGAQTRWIKHALGVIHALMLLSVVYLIPLSVWLGHIGWTYDLEWHILAIIPASVAIYLAWIKVERSLKADLARAAAGLPTRNGIPHHGILVIKSYALILLLAVWIGKTIMAAHDGMPGAVLVFGIGNLITNALVIAAVLVLRRLERGHDPMLDWDGCKAENAAPAPETVPGSSVMNQ